MHRSALPTWSKIAAVGFPVTGGGGWLLSLAGIPNATAIMIAAALLAVASITTAVGSALPRIIESIQKRKVNALKARPDVIKAESEAKSLDRRTKTENKITKIGMKSPEKANLAERMLRARALPVDTTERARIPNDIVDGPTRGIRFGTDEQYTLPEGPSRPPQSGSSSPNPGPAAAEGNSSSGLVTSDGGKPMPPSDDSTRVADLLHQP